MRSSIEPMAELLRSAAKKDRFPVLLRLRNDFRKNPNFRYFFTSFVLK